MSVSERERLALVKSLEGAMGQQSASTLMEYLPASGWRDVARVSDLEASASRTSSRLDQFDSRLTGRIDALDHKIDGVEGRLLGKIDALDHKIDGVEGRLLGKIDGVEGRLTGQIEALRGEMHRELAKQFRTLVVILVTTLTAFGGMLIAAAQIYKP